MRTPPPTPAYTRGGKEVMWEVYRADEGEEEAVTFLSQPIMILLAAPPKAPPGSWASFPGRLLARSFRFRLSDVVARVVTGRKAGRSRSPESVLAVLSPPQKRQELSLPPGQLPARSAAAPCNVSFRPPRV